MSSSSEGIFGKYSKGTGMFSLRFLSRATVQCKMEPVMTLRKQTCSFDISSLPQKCAERKNVARGLSHHYYKVIVV